MEISEIRTAAPAEGRAAVELETFALLDRLHIPYAWVAHETADTIADCAVTTCWTAWVCPMSGSTTPLP